MSGIHDEILKHVQTVLIDELITKADEDDDVIPGAVVLGPLQGNPDPDEARISITLHENDPEDIAGSAAYSTGYDDEVYMVEIGGAITWRRCFLIKARCLLENSREDLNDARRIASTLRSRIEMVLLRMRFTGVQTTTEYVSRGVMSDTLSGEMLQGGGPPDSYDFHIKIRFDVLTTQIIGV